MSLEVGRASAGTCRWPKLRWPELWRAQLRQDARRSQPSVGQAFLNTDGVTMVLPTFVRFWDRSMSASVVFVFLFLPRIGYEAGVARAGVSLPVCLCRNQMWWVWCLPTTRPRDRWVSTCKVGRPEAVGLLRLRIAIHVSVNSVEKCEALGKGNKNMWICRRMEKHLSNKTGADDVEVGVYGHRNSAICIQSALSLSSTFLLPNQHAGEFCLTTLPRFVSRLVLCHNGTSPGASSPASPARPLSAAGSRGGAVNHIGLAWPCSQMAVGQNQWDPILVGRCTTHFRTYFSGDWDVHWGYGLLTHGQMVTSSCFGVGFQFFELVAVGVCLPHRPLDTSMRQVRPAASARTRPAAGPEFGVSNAQVLRVVLKRPPCCTNIWS